MTLYDLQWAFVTCRWTRHFTGYNRRCSKNYGFILKSNGALRRVTFKWTRFNCSSPFTALEQWKISRHRSLWVAVGICTVSKWTDPLFKRRRLTRLYLQKTRFNRTMFPSKPNKLSQEWNLYLISFPKYSGKSFKMGHPICNT